MSKINIVDLGGQNEIGKNIAYIRNKADDLYKEGDALLENAKQKIEKLIFE